MCGSLGVPELMIILAIVVLLFGASRLPQLGKALGETVRNFKKGQNGKDELQAGEEEQEKSIEAHEVAQIVDHTEEPKEAEVAGEGAEKPKKES